MVELPESARSLDDALTQWEISVARPEGGIDPGEYGPQLREELWYMPSDILEWLLPKILKQLLLDVYKNGDTREIETVIEFLYVDCEWGVADDEEEQRLQNEKAAYFTWQNQENARLICWWIKLVKWHPGLEFYQDDVEGAERYWCRERGQRDATASI